MSDTYILNKDHTVRKVPMLEWAEWSEKDRENKRVALTKVDEHTEVSTVFLGLDHNFSESGPPLIFETMVFGGVMGEECDRYSTWDQAVAGHEAMLARVKEVTV